MSSDLSLAALDDTIPEVIRTSRPLAEAHRLDLALFVASEEVSVRVSEAMSRHAANAESRRFAAEQALDDSRHLECFRRRLDLSLAASQPDRASATEAMLLRVLQCGTASAGALRRDEIVSAVVVPPLRRYFDGCQAFADAGSFLEALVMFDLVLKGMAVSLCEYEARYWQPVDPFLAELIRLAAEEDHRHVLRAMSLVQTLLRDEPARRGQAARLGAESVAMLRDALGYYIRKLVGLFAVVMKQHPERYAGAEFAQGEPFAGMSEKGQMVRIGMAGVAGAAQILRQAGLDSDGQ